MSERVQLALIQFAGFLAICVASAIAVWASDKQPIVATACASLVSWAVGKLVGTPISAVTVKSVKSLPPAAAAAAWQNIAGSPPERIAEINRSLPPEQAIPVQRTAAKKEIFRW
jgi:hypothetical protein